jgi:fused signal recognition particle receptor
MSAERLGASTKRSVWSRIKRLALTDVGAIVRRLNAEDLEAIERILIEADFGVPATLDLTEALEEEVRRGKAKTEADLKASLRRRLLDLLASGSDPGRIRTAPGGGLTIIVLVGVNGVGKTTTLAKLAARLVKEGRRVVLAAADTYRAGAIAQLEAWAKRLGVDCVSGAPGGDPAAVAFDAIDAASARGADTVLIDTAGRLHTQDDLMEELRKVTRVVARRAEGAPHETLLVLDGTVGQNAVQQGKMFREAVAPTGLIVTKLDGTARGGAVVALRRELDLPIRFIGLGEGLEDFEAFDPARFADLLLAEA